MQVLVSLTVGLVIWIVLWAIGVKAIDSFLITVLIALIAATGRIVAPFLPGHRGP